MHFFSTSCPVLLLFQQITIIERILVNTIFFCCKFQFHDKLLLHLPQEKCNAWGCSSFSLDLDLFLIIRVSVRLSPLGDARVSFPVRSTAVMSGQHICSLLEPFGLHAMLLGSGRAHKIAYHNWFQEFPIHHIPTPPLYSVKATPALWILSQKWIHQWGPGVWGHFSVTIGPGLRFVLHFRVVIGFHMDTGPINHGKDFWHERRAEVDGKGGHGVRGAEWVRDGEGEWQICERATVYLSRAGWRSCTLHRPLWARQPGQCDKTRLYTYRQVEKADRSGNWHERSCATTLTGGERETSGYMNFIFPLPRRWQWRLKGFKTFPTIEYFMLWHYGPPIKLTKIAKEIQNRQLVNITSPWLI